MKKFSIVLLVIFLASCVGIADFSSDFIGLKYPSDWTVGRVNPYSELVIIEVKTNPNDSLESMIHEYQSSMTDSSVTFTDNSVILEGFVDNPPNTPFISVKDIMMTQRDVDIERKRLLQTDPTLTDLQIVNELARINVAQIALILADAQLNGLTPNNDEIDKELNLVYSEATRQGSTKEQFLGSWGITEEELKFQIEQKLTYSKVLRKLKANNNDISESELATKHIDDLTSTFEIDEFPGTTVLTRVEILEDDGNLIITSTYSDGNELSDTTREIVNSIEIRHNKDVYDAIFIFSAPPIE